MRQKIIPTEPSLFQPFWAGIVSVFAAALVIAIFWVKLPPQVPLFYSRPAGEAELAHPLFLIIPLALSVVFLFLNLLLARFIESDFLKRALVLGATLPAILASITIIRIIFLIS